LFVDPIRLLVDRRSDSTQAGSGPGKTREGKAVFSWLFGWRGRLGRLGYFLVLLGLSSIAFAVFSLGLLFFLTRYLPVVLAAWGFGLLVGLSIFCATTARRLHDLGWHGAHVFWMLALAGLTVAADDHLPGAVLPMEAILLGLGTWLLLMPGQAGANAFGVAPGRV